MAQPGYQDWGRYVVPSADNIHSENVPVQLNYTSGAFDCSSWTSVLVIMDWFDTAAIAAGSINWAGFTASIENITADEFTIGPAQSMSWILPTKGRTVSIGYNPVHGTQTLASRYGLIGLSHPMTKYDAKISNQYLFLDTRAYAANSNVTLNQNFWYEGDVQVSLASSAGGNAVASFQYFDTVSFSFKEFASVAIQTQSLAMPLRLMFPAAPVLVQVFNFGAGQTINVEAIPAVSR